MKKRYALLLANPEYQEAKLANLPLPGDGWEGLSDWLRDPKGGDFHGVEVVSGASMAQTMLTVERFYSNKGPDDLLFLWFGGHAMVDGHGEVFLCLRDSDRFRPKSSAIMAGVLAMHMDNAPTAQKLLALDCRFHSFSGHRTEEYGRPRLRLERVFIGKGNAKHLLVSDTTLHLHAHVDAESALRPPSPFTRAMTAIWREENEEFHSLGLSDLFPALLRRLGQSHKPEWLRIGGAQDLVLASANSSELVATLGSPEPRRQPRDLEDLDWNNLSGEIPLDALGLDISSSRPDPVFPPIADLRGPLPEAEDPIEIRPDFDAAQGMAPLSENALSPHALEEATMFMPSPEALDALKEEEKAIRKLREDFPKTEPIVPPAMEPEPPAPAFPLESSAAPSPGNALSRDMLEGATLFMPSPEALEALQEEEKAISLRRPPSSKTESLPIPSPHLVSGKITADVSDLLDQTMAMSIPSWVTEDRVPEAKASPAPMPEEVKEPGPQAMSPHFFKDLEPASEVGDTTDFTDQTVRDSLGLIKPSIPWLKVLVLLISVLLPVALAGYLLLKSGLLQRLNPEWAAASEAALAGINPPATAPVQAEPNPMPAPVTIPPEARVPDAIQPDPVKETPENAKLNRDLKLSLQAVLKRESPQLDRLFARYLQGYPGLAGVVRIRLEISPDGRIRNARSVGSTTHLSTFDNDVARQALGWKLPPFAGDRSKFVTLPLRFPLAKN